MNALNWNKDFALEQAADDAELLQELLDIFKDSFREDLEIIEAGVAENAPGKISAAAHSIKGASASLGIIGINEVAVAIENDSKGGGIGTAKAQLPLLRQMLQELQTM